MKLYIYDHCPFCVKARIIFGLKHLPVTDVVLLNDDVSTPTRMIGRKMVPILETDGHFMGESMDIVAHVDALDGHPLLTGPTRPETGQWLRDAQQAFIRLALPRFAAAPFAEFATTGARLYFIENKEAMIGPFSTCLAESAALRASVNADLARLARLIQRPDAVNGTLSTDDIHLFAHLRSLTIVAGLDWPMPVRAYCQHMSQATGIPLLDHMAA
ncbi:glutaredoxin 2 [Komagataeibacter europaeus]|uniref:Glutaredoxin n=1 Tax=Komagataeibacter europaeus NBRC 3261 TaxID=1234669 RepID=A0A0D6PVM4_KOMEU|nr:glutaredoxin 2 [Komagataeibacter europaeus]ARW17261.1 Glutaredoxin-2 [Komagataeibacter europaeus]GAN95083.1 glutaredoxin [Komagataeibacter europaeus NBRC 3261]